MAGHRQLLAQALSNMLDNALHYGAAGGEIRLFAKASDSGLALGVADHGPGIAQADHTEARRRFGRLDTSRSAPGAGLGLALVEAVAHLHGGTLHLDDNRPGLARHPASADRASSPMSGALFARLTQRARHPNWRISH